VRRALLSGRPAHRALAELRSSGPRRLALLPLREAPTGRPLHPDELAPVVWTIHAPGDPAGKVEQRRRQIRRMAAEAVAQGAIATVEALADALAVAPRTILRDIQELRAEGITVETRGSVVKQRS
jgi:biotin operon repressor